MIDYPQSKAALKPEVERAMANDVFGSPFVIVDGEPFWGGDRPAVGEEWLKTAGWQVRPAARGLRPEPATRAHDRAWRSRFGTNFGGD